MAERLPVVAAVPNYNMADSLTVLLPQLLAQDYDDIYILDDASTDNSREVVGSFGKDVKFVTGTVNKGAGANRNRIIPMLEGKDMIIHFLDADTECLSDDIPGTVRDLAIDPAVSFTGGLVRGEDGWQNVWNFGPRMSLHAALHAPIQEIIGRNLAKDIAVASRLRSTFDRYLQDWPNPFERPRERRTFWVIESNLVIRSADLQGIGGYDEKLREHEIQDLAIRFAKKGLIAKFNPAVELLQKKVDVRDYDRSKEMNRAAAYIARKHGIRQ
jgi:N-acetylglucosaminyl-diphospho-decaprenol L-rhamnosyltransferase